jgi:glutamate--cysteine ligase
MKARARDVHSAAGWWPDRKPRRSGRSTGCKPPEAWRIGTEHEKFGYRLSDHTPLPYEGACSIRAMLEGLRERFGWTPVLESGNIIGLQKDGANVSLEPGGQLELSGAPLETIHQTCDEVNTHLAEVHQVADTIGAGFIGLGAAPIWQHDDMDVMPKGRYGIMKRYMQTVGSRGLHMMFRTCTVQVNLDFASEPDMVQKLRVALALQPVATALFANSPFWEGKPAGMLSYRAHCWQDLDPDRTGMLPFVFEDGFGFERYVDFALDVPMYFVFRDGKYIDVAGQSFRDFLNGKLPGLPGEVPTLGDWADHLTTIFPEARLKSFIEMRGADGGPWRSLCALPRGRTRPASDRRRQIRPQGRDRRAVPAGGRRAGSGDRRGRAEGPRPRRHLRPRRDPFPQRPEGNCRQRPHRRR